MSKVDSLLEVTAHFFKAGEKVFDILEDFVEIASYGRFLDDKSERYWEFIEKEEMPESNGMFFRTTDNAEHYLIKQDFIGFSFRTVDFVDYTHRGSVLDDIPLVDQLSGYEDTLNEYAREEKSKWENLRALKLKPDDAVEETKVVKFILALENVWEICGSYDCQEWDCRTEIVGKLDMDRIREIIVE
jgi:hypothetical protein